MKTKHVLARKEMAVAWGSEEVYCCKACGAAGIFLDEECSRYVDFCKSFVFKKNHAGLVGVEREYFLLKNGIIAPLAPAVLGMLRTYGNRFGYELSACQLEDRVGPCTINDVGYLLRENNRLVETVEQLLTISRGYQEVQAENMPLDIYPDPSGRYEQIVKHMSRGRLTAACRVIGTHIHIGMPDHETALRVYNAVIAHTDSLCTLGDNSSGDRLRLYASVASQCVPQAFADWHAFFAYAVENNILSDLRQCWTLIRISTHGSIEFRMFGATPCINTIVEWVHHCHALCCSYM